MGSHWTESQENVEFNTDHTGNPVGLLSIKGEQGEIRFSMVSFRDMRKGKVGTKWKQNSSFTVLPALSTLCVEPLVLALCIQKKKKKHYSNWFLNSFLIQVFL